MNSSHETKSKQVRNTFGATQPYVLSKRDEKLDVFEFWDRIKQNIYLNRSENLSKYLFKHFALYDELMISGLKPNVRKRYDESVKEIIKEVKESTYPDLKDEIEVAEEELGIRKGIKG